MIFNYVSIKKNGRQFYYETEESKELLRLHDEKSKKSRRQNPDAELDTHILADEQETEEPSEEAEETVEESAADEESVQPASDEETAEEDNNGDAD